jgi:hypothetical protein
MEMVFDMVESRQITLGFFERTRTARFLLQPLARIALVFHCGEDYPKCNPNMHVTLASLRGDAAPIFLRTPDESIYMRNENRALEMPLYMNVV